MHSKVDANTLHYSLLNYALWFNLEQNKTKKEGTETDEREKKKNEEKFGNKANAYF